jgi:hypothetical protein
LDVTDRHLGLDDKAEETTLDEPRCVFWFLGVFVVVDQSRRRDEIVTFVWRTRGFRLFLIWGETGNLAQTCREYEQVELV